MKNPEKIGILSVVGIIFLTFGIINYSEIHLLHDLTGIVIGATKINGEFVLLDYCPDCMFLNDLCEIPKNKLSKYCIGEF